jgi:UDP-glucuronate decarboxylase
MIIDITGSKSKIVSRPLPPDDPRQRRPDISQAQASLGWQPKVPLSEGLKRTIPYFETLLSNGAAKQDIAEYGWANGRYTKGVSLAGG